MKLPMRIARLTPVGLLTVGFLNGGTAHAQAGSLDPTFGTSGLTSLNLGVARSQSAAAVAVQPDGKLIVAGTFAPSSGTESPSGSLPPVTGGLALLRYLPDGTLDPSFGEGGRVVTSVFNSGFARAVAVQPDGRIVAAGCIQRTTDPSNYDIALVRYTPSGALDVTFSEDGIVTTPSTYRECAEGVSVLPDGRIVIAGYSEVIGGSWTDHAFMLARYTAGGALDPTFGAGGNVRTTFPVGAGITTRATGLVLQPDGRIVVAGSVNWRFALARYTPSGALDPTFGAGGLALHNPSQNAWATALAIRSDGGFVVTGYTCYVNCFSPGVRDAMQTASFQANGMVDATFGVATTIFGTGTAISRDVMVQPDGYVLVAGTAAACSSGCPYRFALVRYTPAGALDPTFGSNGVVTTAFNGIDGASALALLSDGRPIAVGTTPHGGASAVAVARYTSSGALDLSFGDDGRVVTEAAGPGYDEAHALAIQDDGRLIVAGTTYRGTLDFALARFTPEGDPDPTFGDGGRVVTALTPGADRAYAVLVQPDGKIVVAGVASPAPPQTCLALARYLPDGALDLSFGAQGGIVLTCIGQGSEARAVALQPDGRIVVVGKAAGILTARYTPDGMLDPSFGTSGYTLFPVQPTGSVTVHGRALVLLPDGKLVIGGYDQSYSTGGTAIGVAFTLARLTATGLPDSSFGLDGRARISVGRTSGDLASISRHPDGRLIAAGFAQIDSQGGSRAVLAGLLPDGAVDTGFGAGGVVTITAGMTRGADALAVDSDGRIVVGGTTEQAPSALAADFALARLREDGTLDPSFGNGGLVRTDAGGGHDQAGALSLLPDTRIVLAGTATRNGSADFALARYFSSPGVPAEPLPTPAGLTLDAVPNPMQSRARVTFALPSAGAVRLVLYDALGREVALLTEGERAAGTHHATLDATRLAPGVYLLLLEAGGQAITQRVSVVR